MPFISGPICNARRRFRSWPMSSRTLRRLRKLRTLAPRSITSFRVMILWCCNDFRPKPTPGTSCAWIWRRRPEECHERVWIHWIGSDGRRDGAAPAGCRSPGHGVRPQRGRRRRRWPTTARTVAASASAVADAAPVVFLSLPNPQIVVEVVLGPRESARAIGSRCAWTCRPPARDRREARGGPGGAAVSPHWRPRSPAASRARAKARCP